MKSHGPCVLRLWSGAGKAASQPVHPKLWIAGAGKAAADSQDAEGQRAAADAATGGEGAAGGNACTRGCQQDPSQMEGDAAAHPRSRPPSIAAPRIRNGAPHPMHHFTIYFAQLYMTLQTLPSQQLGPPHLRWASSINHNNEFHSIAYDVTG